MGRWSVGVEPRHPVTMLKAAFRTLSMRRQWALWHQNDVQYSAVEWNRDRAAIVSVLVPAFHPEPTSCLSSVSRKDIFSRNVIRWWRNVSDLFSFTPKGLDRTIKVYCCCRRSAHVWPYVWMLKTRGAKARVAIPSGKFWTCPEFCTKFFNSRIFSRLFGILEF